MGSKQENMTFEEFKRYSKSVRQNKAETVTEEEEKQRLEFASQFIKTRKEPGDGSV